MPAPFLFLGRIAMGNDRKLAFVAETNKHRFSISHDGIEKSAFGRADWLGWQFVAEEKEQAGAKRCVGDAWSTTFLEILRYPQAIDPGPLDWRWADTGEQVQLNALQPMLDASRWQQTAIRTAESPDGRERLSFNLYDDGTHRYVLEARVEAFGLVAWEPVSGMLDGLADLTAVEAEAKRKVDWFR